MKSLFRIIAGFFIGGTGGFVISQLISCLPAGGTWILMGNPYITPFVWGVFGAIVAAGFGNQEVTPENQEEYRKTNED